MTTPRPDKIAIVNVSTDHNADDIFGWAMERGLGIAVGGPRTWEGKVWDKNRYVILQGYLDDVPFTIDADHPDAVLFKMMFG